MGIFFLLLLMILPAWAMEKSFPVYDEDEGVFVNPFPSDSGPRRSFWSKWKAWRSTDGARLPSDFLPADSVILPQAFPDSATGLYVTWIGHSSVLMQIDGMRVLLDPVLTRQVSPVPWLRSIRRFQKDAPVSVQDLPEVDAVFLSHDHYDHMDKEALLALAPRTGMFLVPRKVGRRLLDWGVDAAKVREMTWWQEDSLVTSAGRTLKFVCLPARHFSGRSLWDRNTTLWASWAVIGSEHKVFHSGDTGYGPHFAQIGAHYGPFDLNLMECGQYNTLWKQSHMFPEETVQAHQDVGGRFLLPIHWGAFSLSSHDWSEPAERVSAEALKQGVELLTPRVGQTLAIHGNPGTEAWWRSPGERKPPRDAGD